MSVGDNIRMSDDNDDASSTSSMSMSSLLSFSSSDSDLSSISSDDDIDGAVEEEWLEDEPENYVESLERFLPVVLSQRYLVECITKPKTWDFVTRILLQLDDHLGASC